MALSSPVYLLFLGIVWLAVRVLPGARWKKYSLLAASLFFYALLDLRYLALLLFLTVLTYGLGLAIRHGWRVGTCAGIGVAFALIVLIVYKYSAVWVPVISQIPLPGFDRDRFDPIRWLLPVGISFYTFQAISYLMDIYRGRLEPVREIADFGLYLIFFPKIIAGPIVRPTDFFRDIPSGPQPAGRKDIPGIFSLFLRGLFKKVVIADALAGLAGVGFQAAAMPGTSLIAAPVYWRSFYLFAFQIYADFSGYTDIARASAALIGIPLPENFRYPYFVSSITEFWNRWHMSLTQWFREYVFFPLNRTLQTSFRRIGSAIIQAATNIFTMLLIGLWHGAALTYLAWGLWHGVLLSAEKFWKRKPGSIGGELLSGLVVFHLVALGWVLFRSDSLPAAMRFLIGMAAGGQWFLLAECILPVAAAGIVIGVVDAPGLGLFPPVVLSSKTIRSIVSIAVVLAITAIWLLGWATGGAGQPFIYGSF
jgi:D-alanyl-lipoteichoic acid acyltransferase DltB (MBOAT superfamily)